ncbi:MAG: hypothetical protein ACD_73C00298G0001 [uncultured bacterium]|nr:MAG: hypothetical protein ACD_73C00298G0001 [uncultured bacterium]
MSSRKMIQFVLMISCIVWCSLASANDSYMALKTAGAASGDNLLLKDILDLENTSADIIRNFGQISINNAARNGIINPSQILVTLARAGMDLSQLKLLTPADAPIHVIQSLGLESKLKEKILAYLNAKNNQYYDLVINAEDISKIPYNQGDEITVNGMQEDNNKTNFNVSILNQLQNQNSRFILSAKPVKGKSVLTSKKTFLPGDELSRDDIEITNKPFVAGIDYLSDTSFLSNSKVIVKEMIEKGSPILKSSLSSPSTLEKGSIVSLITGLGQVQVRATGRVKDILDNGNSVLVENIDSKKEIVGKPIGANEVRVYY